MKIKSKKYQLITMIKLIIFDLDGVLVDSCDIHFKAFNRSLIKNGHPALEYGDHIENFNGKSTKEKIHLLNNRGIPLNKEQIFNDKQQFTYEEMNNLKEDPELKITLQLLKEDGYILYCASNSIWNTVKKVLLKKGIMECFDYFISNEDVKHIKPAGEIYMKCMSRANVTPKECLVLEDSKIGIQACLMSGANLMKINNTNEVNYNNIKNFIKKFNEKELINVVIPMAGLGSRFKEVGYTLPKPLINVFGKPMIQRVVENLKSKKYDLNFTFIVQKEHSEKYCLNYILPLICSNSNIIYIDNLTEGAACTVLTSKKIIDNDIKLIIANSDQLLEWDIDEFIDEAIRQNSDGAISTFKSNEPKWSYAKTNEAGNVIKVAEKEVISSNATTGIYYWKHGKMFVEYAERMINKGIRVKNEFYVCPVFNEAILDNKKITIQECKKMWGLGTPEDLKYYLQHNQ